MTPPHILEILQINLRCYKWMEFNKCLYKCLPWWLCVCLSWELLKKLALLVSSTTKYKFYEKRSFWDIIIFRCFIWILFRDLRFRLWGIEIKRLKANNFVWKVCFSSFVIISQLRRPIEFKFHRFFFCIYVEIQPVRRLIFVTYKKRSSVFKHGTYLCSNKQHWGGK